MKHLQDYINEQQEIVESETSKTIDLPSDSTIGCSLAASEMYSFKCFIIIK
jgi:hypothetical protein